MNWRWFDKALYTKKLWHIKLSLRRNFLKLYRYILHPNSVSVMHIYQTWVFHKWLAEPQDLASLSIMPFLVLPLILVHVII